MTTVLGQKRRLFYTTPIGSLSALLRIIRGEELQDLLPPTYRIHLELHMDCDLSGVHPCIGEGSLSEVVATMGVVPHDTDLILSQLAPIQLPSSMFSMLPVFVFDKTKPA